MKIVKQRNKKSKYIRSLRKNSDKIKTMKQITMQIIIIISSIFYFNGFSANSQENPVSINEEQNHATQSKNAFSKYFNETGFLEQILIGIIPILIGMGSMALFTFLLTFINHYTINRLANLQKNLPSSQDFQEKKS